MTTPGLKDRPRLRSALLTVTLTLPATAAARAGDESLFVPTGNVVGVFWALVAVFVVRVRWRARLLALALASAGIALPYLLPDGWLAPWLPSSPRAAFMLGFLPPLAAAGLVLTVARWREGVSFSGSRATGPPRPGPAPAARRTPPAR